MRSHSFLALASLLFVATASPLTPGRSDHVVHEKRDLLPSGWQARDRVEGHVKMPLRIGLKQRNLDMGPVYLDEVSNPRSSKYGQHWNASEIIEMFSPRSAFCPTVFIRPILI